MDQNSNLDPRFKKTSQKDNPNIFGITNAKKKHFFAVDNELVLNKCMSTIESVIGVQDDQKMNNIEQMEIRKVKSQPTTECVIIF